MLILTRRPGESVLIGDNIRVKILRTDPTQAQIGIDAPRNIEVDREEVRRAKRKGGGGKLRGNGR